MGVRDEGSRPNRRPLDALDKLLVALSAFERKPRWSLGALAGEVGLPKSTVHRALSKLKAYDFVSQDVVSREYLLGYGVRLLAKKLQDTRFIASVARDHLEELSRASGESSFLTVAEGVYGLCVARRETSQPLRITMDIGSRSPIHRGASNIVLLAHLSRSEQESLLTYWAPEAASRAVILQRLLSIKRAGFAFTVSELSPGAAAMAVPIVDREGDLVAGLSLGGPTERLPLDRAKGFLPLLRGHSRDIAQELGFWVVPAEAGATTRKQKGEAT